MEKQRSSKRNSAVSRLLIRFLFITVSVSLLYTADFSETVFAPPADAVYSGDPCVFTAVIAGVSAGEVTVSPFDITEDASFLSMRKREVRAGDGTSVLLEFAVVFSHEGTYILSDIPVSVRGNLEYAAFLPVSVVKHPGAAVPFVSVRLYSSKDFLVSSSEKELQESFVFYEGEPFFAVYSVGDAAAVHSFSVDLHPSFIISEEKKLTGFPLKVRQQTAEDVAVYRIIPLASGEFPLPAASAQIETYSGTANRLYCPEQKISVQPVQKKTAPVSLFDADADEEYNIQVAADTQNTLRNLSQAEAEQFAAHEKAANERRFLFAVLSAAAFILLTLCALFFRRYRKKVLAVLCIAAACTAAVFCAVYALPLTHLYAFSAGSDIFVIPEENSRITAFARLGLRVRIHKKLLSRSAEDGWAYITADSGESGWMKRNSLIVIE